MRKVRLRLGLGILISAASIAMILSAANAGEHGASTQTGIDVTGNDQKNPLGEETLGNMSRITDSMSNNVGVLSLNQASGNLNNQANVRVFSWNGDPLSRQTCETAETVTQQSTGICSSGGARQNVIEGSVRNNVGIVGVNQSAGNLNSQSNSLFLAVGGLVSLSEVELAGVSLTPVNQPDDDVVGDRSDVIKGSLSGSQGIIQVSQSSGDMNLQANNLALSFTEIRVR